MHDIINLWKLGSIGRRSCKNLIQENTPLFLYFQQLSNARYQEVSFYAKHYLEHLPIVSREHYTLLQGKVPKRHIVVCKHKKLIVLWEQKDGC